MKEKSRRLDWNRFQPELLSVCRPRLKNRHLGVLSRLMVLFTASCQRRNEQPAGGAAASPPAGWPTYFKLEEETLTEVKAGASGGSDAAFIFKENKSLGLPNTFKRQMNEIQTCRLLKKKRKNEC